MERKFKGIWIPKEIYLNTSLSPTEKFLLAEIDSLSSDESGCFASNTYLAEFLQVTKGTVANMISKLRFAGFIIDYQYNEVTGERSMRCSFSVKEPSQKNEGGVHLKMKGGSFKNEGGVHKKMNPYYKDEKKEEKKEEEVPPTPAASSPPSASPFEKEEHRATIVKFLEAAIKRNEMLQLCEGVNLTLPEIREKFADYWLGLERTFTGSNGDKTYLKNSFRKWIEAEGVNQSKPNEKAPVRLDSKIEQAIKLYTDKTHRLISKRQTDVVGDILRGLFKSGVTLDEIAKQTSKVPYLGLNFRNIDYFFENWQKVIGINPESWLENQRSYAA